MAILLSEPDTDLYAKAINGEDRVLMSAPTAFEFRLAAYRKIGPRILDRIDLLLQPPVEIIPWSQEHVAIAVDALRRFGGRPARLNFGDCMTYALAKSLDAPLLYKGDDFARTDIRPAL